MVRYLLKEDFTWRQQTTGVLDEIAKYRVPRNMCLQLLNRPITVLISALEENTTNATAGDEETFSISADYENTYEGESKDTKCYLGTTALTLGTKGSLGSNEYDTDPTNDEYTVLDPGTGSAVDFYYRLTEGILEFRVYDPTERPYKTIQVEDLKDLTSLDPNDEREAIRFEEEWKIPELFYLKMYLKQPDVSVYDESGTNESTTKIKIPFRMLSMKDPEVPRNIVDLWLREMRG